MAPTAQALTDTDLQIDVFDSWTLPSHVVAATTGGRCGLPTPRRTTTPAPERTPAPAPASA